MTKKKQSSFAHAFDTWMKLPMGRRVAIALIILIGAAVVLSLLRVALYGGIQGAFQNDTSRGFNTPLVSSRVSDGYGGMAIGKSMTYDEVEAEAMVSSYMPVPPIDTSGGTGVYDEDEYETHTYSASIRTAQFDEACDAVELWKPFEYVVFEQSQRSEHSCYYRFKTARAYTSSILAAVEALDPDDISVQSEVVKKQMVRYDSQLSILLSKQELLEETLTTSVAAYDELVALSKEAEDVATLSKVLDSKLTQIERLTRERVNLSAQLQSLTRQIAELEDRTAFDYFSVHIQKYEIVDSKAMADSWMYAMQNFARDVNEMFQHLTLGLLLNLLVLAQIIVYLLILLVVGKYGWYSVRAFWKK